MFYSPTRASADKQDQKMKITRLAVVVALSALLSACLGGDIDEVVQRQCPPIAVLVTADVLPRDAAVYLDTATLKCFINRDAEDVLQAEITLSGRSVVAQQVPLFVAALGDNDRQLARSQYKISLQAGNYTVTLPLFVYGKKGGRKPRLVAGFVLSEAELAANRAAYRKKLGLSR